MIIKLNSTKALTEFSMLHEDDTYRLVCRDATGLHYLLVATDFIHDPNVYFVTNDLFVEYCCKHRALNVNNACALACDKDVRVCYGTEAMGWADNILRFKEAAGHPFLIVGALKVGKPRNEQHIGVLDLSKYVVQDVIVRKRKIGLTIQIAGSAQEHTIAPVVGEAICENIPRFDAINKTKSAYVAITYHEAPFLFLDKNWTEGIGEIMAADMDAHPEAVCAWVQNSLIEYIDSIRPSTVRVSNGFVSLLTRAKAFKDPFPCAILKFNINSTSYKAFKGDRPAHTISFVDYLKSVAENWSKSEVATDFMDEVATKICV